ncbi:MAG TPA: SIR2 family protein [Chitinophagaceae bacterium]
MPQTQADHISELRNAFKKNKLTLYLGAGVSQASGLPSWEELVLSLYFTTLKDERVIYELRPFPNYLYALAEWWMKKKKEPLDIIIRKIRAVYDEKDFVRYLKTTLYASMVDQYTIENFQADEYLKNEMLKKNSTLNAVIDCCKASVPDQKGLQAIVSYNYDNLVELTLANEELYEPIWKNGQLPDPAKIPIYHVHGYLPLQANDISLEEIILSEEQYNSMSQDAYYWGNFVQMNQLTNTTGLMIGLSLTDRNMRRILDAVQKMPKQTCNYIVLRRPKYNVPQENDDEMRSILANSIKYKEKFVGGRIKDEVKGPQQVQQIIEAIYKFDEEDFINGFNTLGLKVIFINEHKEIPELLKKIAGKN